MNEMQLLEDLCAAVPPPGPERLAATRARVLSAIAEGRAPAGRGSWPASFSSPGRRRRGWVAPLAAAAAVAAVIVGTQTIFSAIHNSVGTHHHPGPTPPGQRPGPGLARPVTAYVTTGLGTVTPIRTATNRALTPIKVGRGPSAIAITPDGQTAYVADAAFVARRSSSVIPILTATNTPLAPIKVPEDPVAIAITP